MADQIRLSQAVALRFANNTDDQPSEADLDAVQTHWDAEFGGSIAQRMAEAGIPDSPENRAIVQMIATLSPGTSSKALKSACRFVKELMNLPPVPPIIV